MPLRSGRGVPLGRWARSRLEQRGHQLAVWEALVELMERVTA
jgi:hypothetical protein